MDPCRTSVGVAEYSNQGWQPEFAERAQAMLIAIDTEMEKRSPDKHVSTSKRTAGLVRSANEGKGTFPPMRSLVYAFV